MPSVLVVGNNMVVQNLFRRHGYYIIHDFVDSQENPDLVCFTGGEDIGPNLYNEARLQGTHPNPTRDAEELQKFEEFINHPKVGICRGAQLLNVLSGGSLWQDVDGHRGGHPMVDLLFSRQEIRTTSIHHQMMIPGEGAHVLAVANEATTFKSGTQREKPEYDPEVIWIPKTYSLCVQGHPEYSNGGQLYDEFENYFFNLIDWAFDPKGQG